MMPGLTSIDFSKPGQCKLQGRLWIRSVPGQEGNGVLPSGSLSNMDNTFGVKAGIHCIAPRLSRVLFHKETANPIVKVAGLACPNDSTKLKHHNAINLF